MGSRPMAMSFRYPTPHCAITQITKAYMTCPDFCMEYGNGYISILDDVDDMMMLHEFILRRRMRWVMQSVLLGLCAS